MTLLDSLMAQGLRAYRQPRAAAADVLALGFPRHALAPALLLVVVISVVLNTISEYLAPSPFVIISPFQMVMLLTVMLLLFSFSITKAGNWFGGLGKFPDSLLLMIFLQAIFLPAVAFQLLLFVIAPPLAGLFILAVALFLTWIHINFIAALHGFSSLGPAVGVFLLALVMTFFGLMLVAPLFVTPVGDFANV